MAEINKQEKPQQKIITFPRALREMADNGHPHICFSLTGAQAKETDEELERIHLYIPPGFQVSDGANFNSLELGLLNAAEMVRNRESGTKASQVFSGKDKQVMLLKGMEEIGAGGSTGALAAYKQGIAFNPQTALAFESVNLRQFSFAFTLVPESKEEAEDARRIEGWFRKYLYPKTDTGFSLTYPPKFKIQFFQGESENKFMPMIHDCYLAGVEATFNPDSNAFFVNGQPTAINIGLSFSEAKMLTRTDLYKQSGSDDDPQYDYSRPGSFQGT